MNSPFAAAVIAGGRSERFGTDKAFHQINGTPLWRHQVHKIEQLMPSEIIISANNEQHFETNYKVVLDSEPDRGPLGALIDCLNATKIERVLILAVDMPQMPISFLGELVCSGSGSVPVHANEMSEPLAAVYPKEIIELAKNQFLSGSLSMQELVNKAISMGLLKTRKITEPEIEFFANMNYPPEI
ncbi:MAG: molybdenum cofactor guanylyltransferase [Verrucomicrobiota bacterium]|nr:molybdenum cofactor guanylyltransferase [Verrucomicrobiota bacterium]MEE2966977.1 molybdenum cofactor guanylyltransferase [Verrucomicrobiota bacterium]